MNQEKIGSFIKECRKNKNLTQEQLAQRLQVTDKAVSKWENGRCLPDASLFSKLCNELDITINELLSGEKLSKKDYQEKTEKMTLNLIDNIHKSKRKYIKISILIILIFLFLFILINIFLNTKMKVPYDSRIMECEIKENNLVFKIKGLSILTSHHTVVEKEDEEIYFVETAIPLNLKKRSYFESYDSMAKLLDGKEESFGYQLTLPVEKDKKIKVYHTDISLKKIEKSNESELEDIIKKSNLMCERK